MAAQASLSSGAPEALLRAFKQCLAVAKRFDMTLSADEIGNAFASVWQQRTPTLVEAGALLDLLQAQRVLDSGITRSLVPLLVVTEEGLSDPKQKDLKDRLSSEEIYPTLGDRSLTVGAFHFANRLLEAEDAVIAIEDALAFLKRHFYQYERYQAVRSKEMMEARVDAVFDSLRQDSDFIALTRFADGRLMMPMKGVGTPAEDR